jgi:pimeloyl-ACP methyl ester carboxylesterase
MSSVTGSDPRLEEIVEALLTPRRLMPQPGVARYEDRGDIDMPSGRVAYWSTGTGKPVLLVHGWEGSHADLDFFVQPLLACGARVVALDLPAHGESDGTRASLPDFAAAIGRLGEIVGPLAGVIAHSVGCPATALAISHGLRTERAVIIATPTRYERWAREFALESGADPDAVIAALIARGIDVASLDMVKTVSDFTLPALIVHSSDDRVTDARGSRAVSEAWRGSRLRYVEGLGHSRILRDAGVIAEAVDFVLPFDPPQATSAALER